MLVVTAVPVGSTWRVELGNLVLDPVTIFAGSEDFARSVMEEVASVPSTSDGVFVGSSGKNGIVSELTLVCWGLMVSFVLQGERVDSASSPVDLGESGSSVGTGL